MQNESFSHWSRYWASGPLTSLPQDFRHNYDGEVADFWRHIARDLPDKAATLDVCTGNGAVALLLAAQRPDLNITALDAAQIQPDQLTQRYPELAAHLEKVQFLSNCPLASALFTEGQFSLVSSQYGLEYVDAEAAAPLIARWLCPKGRLALVTHSPDSEMVETMVGEAAEYKLLFASSLWRAAEQFAAGQAGPETFGQSLAAGIEGLKSQAGFKLQSSELLISVLQSLTVLARMETPQLLAQRRPLSGYLAQLQDAHARLLDMLAVNRKLRDDPNWYQPFLDQGLSLLQTETLRYQGKHHCGQGMVFQKPSS